MNNFEFYNPVKIFFGKDEISKIKEAIPSDARVLITYGGGSIKRNGVLDQVVAALGDMPYWEFGGIEPNPHFETLMKAVEEVKEKKIDFLLAVGGGSVLDGTKFIAAAAHFEGTDPWDICARQAPVTKAVSLGAVLTLPATGSEMNAGGVVTRVATLEKLAFQSPLVFPKFSVLDPSVLESLPSRQRSNGVVDAFVHVLEQYLTFPVNAPIQDRFAEGILHTLIEQGPIYCSDPENYEAAANIMWSATLALNGLIGCGVPQDWATHLIGHELTVLHGIDHGQTLAIVIPGVMAVMKEQKREKLLQYADRIWGLSQGSEEDRIEKAIEKTETFFKQVGVATRLKDYHVGEDVIEEVIDQLEKHRMVAIGESREVTLERVKEILALRL